MIVEALHRVADCRESLSREEARAVTSEILSGKCTDAQIAALLVALHMKGETVEEIVGFAEAIRAVATPLNLHRNSTVDVSGTGREALVDTCGTGGSASATFNISTATAFVVAGAGVRVAKHGNRSISSKKGSADVMEALGVNIQLSPDRIAACLEEVGIGCGVHYPIPVHLQQACQNLGYTAGAFPVAENLAGESLSLPMFPELTEEQIEYVARCVTETVAVGALV